MSRIHLASLVALIALGVAPVSGAVPASVSGVVRDSAGVAQIGAVVELLRPDLTVAASVYTDSKGRFTIPYVVPGQYAVKAMAASFLPSLRENVRVHAKTVVDLTLNTLYEVMQWLPAEPRAANEQSDDWAWTLRSAANRPLLRWLEDGPLVVVSDGAGAKPRLKARLIATGQEGTFGESGERFSASVEDTPSDSRELLARVDFEPGTDAGMESMLGFRQDLGFAGSVQSVAAVAIHPEMEGPEGNGSEANGPQSNGLDEVALRTWETMHLGDEFEAEAGSTQVLARFAENSPNVIAAALPFASLTWRKRSSTVGYRVATASPGSLQANSTEADVSMPALSVHNGTLVMQHGLHQEIGWERRTDASSMSVLVFADNLQNPALEAAARFAAGTSTAAQSSLMLFDPASGLLRTAGPSISTAGMQASVERRIHGNSRVRLSYANGDALVMTAPSSPVALAQAFASAHPHRAQMYSLSLSGTLEGTGTRWRASYRWQPEDTVTPASPYSLDAAEPWLNLHLRQPIHIRRDGCGGLDALLDMHNLLAQGYRTFLLSDGSLLLFAQDQRSLQAGLAFTF
jgi:hypothetical protein